MVDLNTLKQWIRLSEDNPDPSAVRRAVGVDVLSDVAREILAARGEQEEDQADEAEEV